MGHASGIRARPTRQLAGSLAVLALCTAATAQAPDRTIHKPAFHYSPQRGWMNDPNGLVFHDGEYHLFYQHNPHGDRWGHIGWGHAVSRDLVRWRELPVAIRESEVMAYSGSVVVDTHNSSGLGAQGRPAMVALFTGHHPVTKRQAQYLAYSTDRGRTWQRYGSGPVLDIGSTEFRDPKVFWHAPSQRWVMTVVRATDRVVAIYTSRDLKSWDHASDFGPAGSRDGAWECPDLFELPVDGTGERRWVMAVSVFSGAPGGGSGGQYFVGDFDGRRFTTTKDWGAAPVWMDRGADFYAAASWNDVPDGRRLWIAWASNWRYANAVPTFPERGAMTIPRALTLRRTAAGLRLAQSPVAELTTLRGESRSGTVRLGAREVPLPVPGEPVELALELDLRDAEQAIVALTDAQGYRTLIGVDPALGEVFVDRTRSGPHVHDSFPDRHSAPVSIRNGRVRLRVFVDRSIIEVFADDGVSTITDRFFRGGGALRFTGYSVGGAADMTVESWPMRPGVQRVAVDRAM